MSPISDVFVLTTDPYGDLLEPPTFGGEGEEEEEEGEEEAVRKYQALLQGIRVDDRRKEDKNVEMEVSWGLGEYNNVSFLVSRSIVGQLFEIKNVDQFSNIYP